MEHGSQRQAEDCPCRSLRPIPASGRSAGSYREFGGIDKSGRRLLGALHRRLGPVESARQEGSWIQFGQGAGRIRGNRSGTTDRPSQPARIFARCQLHVGWLTPISLESTARRLPATVCGTSGSGGNSQGSARRLGTRPGLGSRGVFPG